MTLFGAFIINKITRLQDKNHKPLLFDPAYFRFEKFDPKDFRAHGNAFMLNSQNCVHAGIKGYEQGGFWKASLTQEIRKMGRSSKSSV